MCTTCVHVYNKSKLLTNFTFSSLIKKNDNLKLKLVNKSLAE